MKLRLHSLRNIGSFRQILLTIAGIIFLSACNSVDDDRIPNYAVNINIADAGLWNSYGVAGFGSSRNFILGSGLRLPSGFPFNQQSATGFGGVLLINGMDPFTNETDVPLAYDLACPVECKQNIRVEIEGDLYEAVCPVCGSHYNVTMMGGAPLSGPAATGKQKYGLRRYKCVPSGMGGYIIINTM